jgi:hypothetical protein
LGEGGCSRPLAGDCDDWRTHARLVRCSKCPRPALRMPAPPIPRGDARRDRSLPLGRSRGPTLASKEAATSRNLPNASEPLKKARRSKRFYSVTSMRFSLQETSSDAGWASTQPQLARRYSSLRTKTTPHGAVIQPDREGPTAIVAPIIVSSCPKVAGDSIYIGVAHVTRLFACRT